ncbi:SapC family protein [Hydrogenovibrio halophilus]|uniref:SapC family protein n=1 Tax=Hydrogenovibrio halophilus TaxID=373391 RepID=UPI00037EEFE9|nr:SapC family protein [Hydrogenovibrio halophilus]
MPTWKPIQKTVHQDARWQPYTDYQFAKNDTTAPLLMAEMANALPFYPMGFVKTPKDEFQLVAVQSLQPNLNLFVNAQGKWRVPYVPSVYRGYPFKMLKAETNDSILCVDTESKLFLPEEKGDKGQPLFAEQGELSEPMQKVVDFLQQCEQNRQATQQAVTALNKAELITPWSIQTRTSENTEKPVKGLYKIDEASLKKLPGETLEKLSQSNALAVAYSQLLSMPRLKGLSQLYKLHETEQQKINPREVDLDQLFGEDDDDSLKF